MNTRRLNDLIEKFASFIDDLEKELENDIKQPITQQTQSNTGSPNNGPPTGFQAIRGAVPSEVSAKAKSLLGGDYGQRTLFQDSLGNQYVGQIEKHYHPGPTEDEKQTMSNAELNAKYPTKPWGWHKGCTIYKKL